MVEITPAFGRSLVSNWESVIGVSFEWRGATSGEGTPTVEGTLSLDGVTHGKAGRDTHPSCLELGRGTVGRTPINL